MSLPRASGVLLHPTSLPSRFGIGDLGSEAYQFADLLTSTGQHLWQLLPLGPTGYANPPYQCLSAFTGNPLLASPERLVVDKALESAHLENAPSFTEDRADYSAVIRFKMPPLKKSFDTFIRTAPQHRRNEFEVFCRQSASWLETYSLFMALKEAQDPSAWNTWEEDIRTHQPKSMEHWSRKLHHDIQHHKYRQDQFLRQWLELKKCCNDRGIRLIGDMPIFIALDSVEVWSHPEMFYLDDSAKPTMAPKVSPDYFSETGQLWGSPLYRWDVMARNGST